MDAESFSEAVHLLLKTQGFKRRGFTWRKHHEESVSVFNVQKSQWGDSIYYVNVGKYFFALVDESQPPPTLNKCHVQRRIDVAEPEQVVQSALHWFRDREKLHDAALLAESDSTKGVVFKELRLIKIT